jgi:RNA polymerase sigma factor for flagellar operon FliA
MTAPVQAYQSVSARQSRDELILAHLPLVRHTIGRLLAQLPPGVDVDNLVSAGTLGLVEAANKFDPERGVKFESFAAWRVRGAMLDELRRNCPVPQQLLERIALIRQAYAELPLPVTLEALAQATGLAQDEISDGLAAMQMTRMVSWENLSEARQAQIQAESPEDSAEFEDQKRLLTRAITHLPQRERLVVTMYYLEDLRLKEIGRVLQLSESRVSRLLNGALFNLGEFMRQHGA